MKIPEVVKPRVKIAIDAGFFFLLFKLTECINFIEISKVMLKEYYILNSVWFTKSS